MGFESSGDSADEAVYTGGAELELYRGDQPLPLTSAADQLASSPSGGTDDPVAEFISSMKQAYGGYRDIYDQVSGTSGTDSPSEGPSRWSEFTSPYMANKTGYRQRHGAVSGYPPEAADDLSDPNGLTPDAATGSHSAAPAAEFRWSFVSPYMQNKMRGHQVFDAWRKSQRPEDEYTDSQPEAEEAQRALDWRRPEVVDDTHTALDVTPYMSHTPTELPPAVEEYLQENPLAERMQPTDDNE